MTAATTPSSIETVVPRPFGDLIRFNVQGRAPTGRKVLLVAPMSGHYATLLRSTVLSLLPDCDVYITDWHNARDIPVSEGKFDIEDYTLYLVDFLREMGPDTHVIAVCQPAPLALAATAYLAEEDPDAQPRTLTLIGGPIDPDAAATDVTDFGRRVTMGQLERYVPAARRLQIRGRGPHGLSGPAAAVVLHGDERRKARQGLLRTGPARRQGRGLRPRQAQQVLRRIPRRDGHDGGVLPLDRRADLQGARDRAEPLHRGRQARSISARSPPSP
jgi:hypothetical protein